MGCCAAQSPMPYPPSQSQGGGSQIVYIPGTNTPQTAGYQNQTPIPTPQITTNQPMTNSGISFSGIDHPLFEGMVGEGTKLFYFGDYAGAAQIYRNYLQSKAETSVKEIDGMGQKLLALGFYQWFPFRFYKQNIQKKRMIGTVYDALSLCYMMLQDDGAEVEKGIKWYSDMVDAFDENIGFIMGLANILCNKGVFQEAMDYYQRVQDFKPTWVRPLECIAYIHEYKRVDKKKSIDVSNKILTLEPNNRVGLFIIGRNGSNADDKIEKLKICMQQHPEYARCVNEIGIVNGGTKKLYREAITWYQKAIQITPQYASCYNNIGVNFELLKDYDEAITWYFRGIEKDRQYKAPHKNLSDIIDDQKMTDEDVSKHMAKYRIQSDYFYYYMGLSYYDKKNYQESIKYYMKAYDCAKQLTKNIYKIHNSTGITYDDMRQDDNALKYYMKCIGANYKYHSAYYNMAIVFKRQKNIDQAIHWYKKAIEVNPRYSYAYNNLGNIYKDRTQYDEAIKCYKNAVKHLSTYTLALVNMGVCYLKTERFREAFNALERAKDCLPTDNNNLSKANKDFMNGIIDQFDRQGESWRQNGCITSDQRSKLQSLIKNFESSFGKKQEVEGKQPVSIEKVLKKEVLQIVRLIENDKFSLSNVEKVYDLIKDIYEDNQEYFHILPLLYIQYFYNNAFTKKRPILEIERQLFAITKKLSEKTAASLGSNDNKINNKNKFKTEKMKYFNPNPQGKKIDLFKPDFFESYQEVYAEIVTVNQTTGQSYKDFENLVNRVTKQSYGEKYGIGMKIPRRQDDEVQIFKVILRIFEKMFKDQLTKQRVDSIIQKIDTKLEKTAENKKKVELSEVIQVTINVWTSEITEIVQTRKKNKKKTSCFVSDLLRAKIMYSSLDHLKKAMRAVDEICFSKSFEVLELDNRLSKKQTQDVVFKIKIRNAVCELQLALKQDESTYHFTHAIYEIQRSPLGCIFGSYIFISKRFNYPFIENCKDIVNHLKNAKSEEDKKTLQAAKYVVENMTSQ